MNRPPTIADLEREDREFFPPVWRAVAIVVATAVWLFVPWGCAHAATAGLHISTAHSKPGFDGVNPGVYYRADSGFTAGVFRNSYGAVSAYAGVTLETKSRRFALTAGGVTGYPSQSISPLLVPSVRQSLGPFAARLSLIPKPPKHGSSAGLHLSIERDF